MGSHCWPHSELGRSVHTYTRRLSGSGVPSTDPPPSHSKWRTREWREEQYYDDYHSPRRSAYRRRKYYHRKYGSWHGHPKCMHLGPFGVCEY